MLAPVVRVCSLRQGVMQLEELDNLLPASRELLIERCGSAFHIMVQSRDVFRKTARAELNQHQRRCL